MMIVSALLNIEGLIPDHNLSPEEMKLLFNFPPLVSCTQMVLQWMNSRRFTEALLQFLIIVFVIQIDLA